MEWIKYYSEYDMTTGMNISKIIEFANRNSSFLDEDDINKILEYHNIIKFYAIENCKNVFIIETEGKIDDVIRAIKARIGKFVGIHKSDNFLILYANVVMCYREDFWELVDKYNIYENIYKSDFEFFLKNSNIHYPIILKNMKIVDKFDEVLRDHMLQDKTGAKILFNKYFHKGDMKEDVISLPRSLTESDKEKILLNYIEAEGPNINHLEMIINFPSNSELKIGDRIKLKAKRRYKEEVEKIFDGNNGFEMGVAVKYAVDQKEAVIYNENGLETECSVSRSWIENNLDFNTLWNNFIYIFDFFDSKIRLRLVSLSSEVGILEKITKTKSKHLYENSSVYRYKDMLSTIQIQSYVHVLNNYQIRLEDMIEWFFVEYLSKEFGINNYIVKMPTNASSDFEKCRAILPEIDRISKQYNLYLEDGEIDQELLQVSSSHIFFKDCKSSIDKKYVYPVEGIFGVASSLLFSDQSAIYYIPKMDDKYHNFYDLLSNEKVKLNDFEEIQIKGVTWLIENQLVNEDNGGYLKFTNQNRIILFADMYFNEVISYWNCLPKLRDEIDVLINENLFVVDNKLFTKGEQDYFDYHLNKSKFSNSLDLRNSYLHGTQINDDDLSIRSISQ